MNNPVVNNRKYQLIVFDWDGTLADSLGQIVTAMEQAIIAHNIELPGTERIMGHIGLGLTEFIGNLLPDMEEGIRSKVANSYREHYLSSAADITTLFPYAEETIKTLFDDGYYLAVATGKSRRGLERSLGHTNLSGYFHITRCADETFSKPDPQMLLEIMELLDIPPQKTIMVGDSEFDMQMAENAGVTPIAVNYGAQCLHRLLEFNPVTILQSLLDLPIWLAQQQTLKFSELR